MITRRAPKLGWIKPDDNVRPDHDCYKIERWLGERGLAGIEVVVRTSPSSGIHAEQELYETGAPEALVPPAKELAEAGADVVVWACTSASFIGGLEWSRRQAADMARAAGRPATSTSLAILEAARHLGASKVDILGTYPAEITAALARMLEEGGLRVENIRALNIPTGRDAFALDLRVEAQTFADAVPGSRNPVVIPDTAANSLDLLEDLETILRRPVMTAVQVSLWHGLVLTGLRPSIPSAGHLFRIDSWPAAG